MWLETARWSPLSKSVFCNHNDLCQIIGRMFCLFLGAANTGYNKSGKAWIERCVFPNGNDGRGRKMTVHLKWLRRFMYHGHAERFVNLWYRQSSYFKKWIYKKKSIANIWLIFNSCFIMWVGLDYKFKVLN